MKPALLYPPHIPFGEEESSFYKFRAARRNAGIRKLDACAGDSANRDSDEIGDHAFDCADESHFESTGPPRTDGDQRLGGTHGEVGH